MRAHTCANTRTHHGLRAGAKNPVWTTSMWDTHKGETRELVRVRIVVEMHSTS